MTYIHRLLFACLLLPAALLAEPLSSAFSYQGQLSVAGSPAEGPFDLSFTLHDAAVDGMALGPALTLDDVVIEEGLFSVELDFGFEPFAGDQLWLAIEVREGADTGAFQALAPPQKLTAAPYALHAEMVAANSVGSAELAPNSVGAVQVDDSQVQRRVTGSCPTGESIRAVANDGSVTCEVDDAGNSFWGSGTSDALEPDRSVRIQPGTPFPFVVRHDSTVLDPHLALTETTDGDFTRLSFYNDQQSFTDPEDPTLWTIAGLITDNADNDRLHFYHRRAGNVLSLTGNGRLGIGTQNPIAPFAVGTQDNWRWDIGNGRGDLYLGDGLVGLSFGVTLAGGGRGFSHIWTNGGLEGLTIGAAGFGPQLAIVDDKVQLFGLAQGQSSPQPVVAQPDGTLALAAASEVRYLSISPSAFSPVVSDWRHNVQPQRFTFVDSAGESRSLSAPVTLPNGATVTEVTFWFTDADPTPERDLAFILLRNNFADAGSGIMASVESSGGQTGVQSLSDITITGPAVDNENSSYGIRIASTNWSNDFDIRGVRIGYTL